LPAVAPELAYSVVTVGGFLFLLLQDRIHPLVVLLLQAYLAA
jgi:hypothetical protein